MKLKLVLVGLGTWAEIGHIPVYLGPRLSSRIDLVALCSRDLGRARDWCDRFGISKAFDDFADMLEASSPDIVAVTTPDGAHASYVIAALEHGCHVLVEKPLATTLEECEQIMAVASRVNRRVITLYHKRADPLWDEARQRIRSGAFGALQMGVASIQNPLQVPAGDYFSSALAAGSDPNWFLGTHFYDLLRYMTGLTPVSVNACAWRKVLPEKGVDTLDAIKADVQFSGEHQSTPASVSFMVSWNLPEPSTALTKQGMQLHFERGELELDGTRRGYSEFGPAQYRDVNPYFMRRTGNGLAGYGVGFLEDAVLSLVDPAYEPAVPLPDLQDAWWASALATAVQESCRNGRSEPVRLPPSGAV